MDWENPLRSIAPTVDADVLKALAEAREGVTGNQLAHLAGRSYAQVYAVVRRLASDGVVRSSRFGRTNVFELNREHSLVHGMLRVLASPSHVESEIRRSAMGWDPPAETIAFIGEAARRSASRDDEIRVLVVRRDGIDPKNSTWKAQVDGLSELISDLAGNTVRVIEATRADIATATAGGGSLAGSLSGGIRTISGKDLRSAGGRTPRD